MAGTVRTTGKKPINTSEKDPSKIAGEGNLSTGGTRAARAARAKKEQNSNSNNDSKSLNDVINGVKGAAESVATKKSSANKNTSSKSSSEDIKSEEKQNESTKETTTTVDVERVLKELEEATKKIEELSKTNQNLRSDNNILRESIKQRAEEDAKKSQETSKEELQVNNSETAEETVIPEPEVKTEGEPKANTEQTQATQEPKSEAKQTSTESSEMTPEEAYEYLSDKKNFKDAERYFASDKNSYIGTNNKHIPKSWFDVYKGNKDSDHSVFRSPNNKDVFTASLKDKGLLKDPNKEPDRAETEKVQAEADAKRKFDEWIDSKGNKFRGIFGKHKLLYSALLLGGISPAIMKGLDALGDWYVNKAIEDNHVSDEEFFGGNNENDDYNGEPIEPGEVADKVANAAQETKQTNDNAEEQAAQALQENLPQGVAGLINQGEGESPVATNASTPASTKASTAESAPTQGLPPIVTRDAPPANPDSSGMTYSQRVEAAGQAPQAGSMAYNANNPDMVTANLINAMNQASQAGSDAIGYGDLYDQNFIDFWAKRNPNLAFGVSQGRR